MRFVVFLIYMCFFYSLGGVGSYDDLDDGGGSTVCCDGGGAFFFCLPLGSLGAFPFAFPPLPPALRLLLPLAPSSFPSIAIATSSSSSLLSSSSGGNNLENTGKRPATRGKSLNLT